MCQNTVLLIFFLFLFRINTKKLNLGNTAFIQPTVIIGALGWMPAPLLMLYKQCLTSPGDKSTPSAFDSATTCHSVYSCSRVLVHWCMCTSDWCTSFSTVLMGNTAQPIAFAGLPLTPAPWASSGTIATQSIAPFDHGGQSTGKV